MVDSIPPLRLTLFFTRGVSLKVWDELGILEREVSLYRKLIDRGVQVGFITYGDASDLTYQSRLSGIRIFCNHWNLKKSLYPRLVPLLHWRWLLHSNVFKTNQIDGGEVALRAARLWKKPLIARCGYMWSYFASREFGKENSQVSQIKQIEERVFKAAQKAVVTTKLMKGDISKRIPKIKDRIELIPNYTNLEHFYLKDKSVTKQYTVAYVGRISPQKNVASLLEAVSLLKVNLLLIGPQEGDLFHELQRRFATLNGKICWQKSVPNNELVHYLNRASLFVLPSFYEGHPKAMIEAMACGLPVIGADSPGIRELIRHGENGWLCAPDAKSIRQAIQHLLSNPELCQRLGQNARIYVRKHFDLERIVELEMNVLRQVIQ